MRPKIDRVTIVFNVRDIDRTERFYREHLGIDFQRLAGRDFTLQATDERTL